MSRSKQKISNLGQRTENNLLRGCKDRKEAKLTGNLRKHLLLWFLIAAVCVIVCTVHWPALSSKATYFDDSEYLDENNLVRNPGWNSTKRFLTEVFEPSSVDGYYQPLAMISLMLDYARGGRPDNYYPFHQTNLCLHIANTVLVILLIYLLFNSLWVACAAGLLFGIHPMTVEPICWISDRKTLLAAFCAFLSLIGYVRFVNGRKWAAYAGSFVAYALAMMSKPTTVMLPVVMLLMDFWPFNRLSQKSIKEKIPFLALGAAGAVIAYISQSSTAQVKMPGEYGLSYAPLVLCYNVVFYLYKIFWPACVSSFYDFPRPFLPSNPVVLISIIGTIVLITTLLISLRRTRATLTGWLIFFTAVLPAMGVLRFSAVIAADKFVYLPSIGILMAIASFLIWVCSKYAHGRIVAASVLVLIFAGEGISARKHIAYWQDNIKLNEYMITISPHSSYLRRDLAKAYNDAARTSEAMQQYLYALKLRPAYPDAHNEIGNILIKEGKIKEAMQHFNEALRIKPDFAGAHNNLCVLYNDCNDFDSAIAHGREAVKLAPQMKGVYFNLGIALYQKGKVDEAIETWKIEAGLDRENSKVRTNLAAALSDKGRLNEAVKYLQEAISINPKDILAHINLGEAFVRQGLFEQAEKQYRQALELSPGDINIRKRLETLQIVKTKSAGLRSASP